MKAVILAAGCGTRMGPLTSHRPKCLIPVTDRVILDYQLDPLRTWGVEQCVFISGHAAECLKPWVLSGDSVVHNPEYATTNSMYSLWLAREELRGQALILFNSDIVIHPRLIEMLLGIPEACATLVDRQVLLRDGEMNIKIRDNAVTDFSKALKACDADGESVQITKFGAGESEILFDRIRQFIDGGETSLFPAAAFGPILKRSRMVPVYCDGLSHYEIDTLADLEQCRERIDF